MGRIRYLLSATPAPAPQLSLEPVVSVVPEPAAPQPVVVSEPRAAETYAAATPAATPDAIPAAETPAGAAKTAEAETALKAALESLGKAHHRPFSRG